jgi:predicted XRE-type DNA-binding protein
LIVRARFRDADPVPTEAVSTAARLLTLAYAVEAAVEDERFGSVAEVAAVLGLSRSRLSQVMRKRWGSVAEQERVLGDQQPAGLS